MKTIQLAHGSGGTQTRDLIDQIFMEHFKNPLLEIMDDSAIIPFQNGKLAFTTDSFVVNPPFFPGGDIGKLAVCGTVNDLAVSGAQPLYLSCGFILEEGLPVDELVRIVSSMRDAARQAGVQIVTGDTKVVGKGAADRIFINTAGIGVCYPSHNLGLEQIRPGDRIVINGSIGDHGIAVLCQRAGLNIETEIQSDCAPLNDLIKTMLEAAPDIRFLRDPTRGGLATTLNEIISKHHYGILLEENAIQVKESVRAVCELLGLDPLYIANEGKVVAVVPEEQLNSLLTAMRLNPSGHNSTVIGEIRSDYAGHVALKTGIGGTRMIPMLAGDQLPRIC